MRPLCNRIDSQRIVISESCGGWGLSVDEGGFEVRTMSMSRPRLGGSEARFEPNSGVNPTNVSPVRDPLRSAISDFGFDLGKAPDLDLALDPRIIFLMSQVTVEETVSHSADLEG